MKNFETYLLEQQISEMQLNENIFNTLFDLMSILKKSAPSLVSSEDEKMIDSMRKAGYSKTFDSNLTKFMFKIYRFFLGTEMSSNINNISAKTIVDEVKSLIATNKRLNLLCKIYNQITGYDLAKQIV